MNMSAVVIKLLSSPQRIEFDSCHLKFDKLIMLYLVWELMGQSLFYNT